jgi:aryl-alcohol dehydrogenase-like predicted oxidoreductase
MIAQSFFGRTGHLSTRVIFGAYAVAYSTQSDADRALDLLLRYGINHIDTAFSYGESELRVGPWMKRYRKEFFLATKTGERTYQKAKEGIHRSLDRLQTDHVDLIQFHHLVEPDEWEVALGPGGALEAAVEAREQGLVRFIGVTGHEIAIAEMHLRSLARFDFDSVLLPCNYPIMQNPRYAANFERVVALCQERNVAVQTIKGIQRRAWGDRTPTYATWYEPLLEPADIDLAVGYVLGRPGLFLNSAGDLTLLPKILDAAEQFKQVPPELEMQALADRLEMSSMFV